MAFADPQSITVNGNAQSMPRIQTTGSSSVYMKNDTTFSLAIKHTTPVIDKKRRVKSLAVFTERLIAADPLVSPDDWDASNISLQIDRPEVGFTSARIDQLVAGFVAWCSPANVAKLFGRET